MALAILIMGSVVAVLSICGVTFAVGRFASGPLALITFAVLVTMLMLGMGIGGGIQDFVEGGFND